MSAPIAIVNENDEIIGSATKQEAWDKGLIHRIVRIMLAHPDGRILIQHRTPAKDIFPNCWDNSVAGHVDAGEDYDAAAQRELTEELGLGPLLLEKIGYYRSNETWKGHRFNRFTTCYKATLSDTPQKLEAGKVDATRWVTVNELKRLVVERPDVVTDGLRQVVERFY